MSDIVKRLRTTASQYMTSNYSERLMHEAADEIERLRAELQGMKDAAAARDRLVAALIDNEHVQNEPG